MSISRVVFHCTLGLDIQTATQLILFGYSNFTTYDVKIIYCIEAGTDTFGQVMIHSIISGTPEELNIKYKFSIIIRLSAKNK